VMTLRGWRGLQFIGLNDGESSELSPGHGFYLAVLSGHRRRESQGGGENHGEDRSSAMKRLRWRSDLIQGTVPS
jgi:hypothetical protein